MRNALMVVTALVLAGTVFCGFAYADDGQTGTNPSSGGGLVAGDADNAKAAQEQARAEAELKAKIARKAISDGLYNMSLKSSAKLSLSVKGSSARAGAPVVASGRDASNWAQKWAVSWDADAGYYRIRNLNSRKCLGVSGAVKTGAVVKQVKLSNSARQFWEPVKASDGTVVFKLAGSQLALTVKGSKSGASFKLQNMKAGASTAQRFNLGKVRALETNKTYFVRNVATGKRLEVAGGSTKANAKLGLAKASSAKSQKFRVVKSGSSAFGLQNVGSCYYAGTNAAGKGAVRQLKSKNSKAKWKIKLDLKAAAFTIASGKSGRRIDGAKGKLQLKKGADSSTQLFTFSRTYAYKLFLNPGHGANSNGNGAWDPGAVGTGHEEAEFTHDLCRRVENLLADSDVKVVNGEKYRLAYWRRLPKAVSLGCDAIVSVHFDAGGGSGTLKMVGAHGRARGSDALASFVQKGVVSKLGLPDRGRVTRGDITCVNGSIPSMLVEVCFMDNAHDVHTYLRKKNAVAQGLASGIIKASRSRSVVVR